MKKAEFLRYWAGLEANASIPVSPIEYKHEGSTYGEDSLERAGRAHWGISSAVVELLQEAAPL